MNSEFPGSVKISSRPHFHVANMQREMSVTHMEFMGSLKQVQQVSSGDSRFEYLYEISLVEMT